MSYTHRNFATKISFKKGFLKSFLVHPLIAFNKEHIVERKLDIEIPTQTDSSNGVYIYCAILSNLSLKCGPLFPEVL